MEPLRDVRKIMEREVRKGSFPLMFDGIEFGASPLQPIKSEEKLGEVLAYLLRLKQFRQYAEKTVTNNVYMDLGIFCKEPRFRRTHSAAERGEIYRRIQRHKNRLRPDYGGGVWLETARCIFTFPEGEAEKHRITRNGKETYAFIMSGRHILGLSDQCRAARETAVRDGCVKGVLFQALLLDDVECSGGKLSAGLYTIYCTE